MPVGVRCAAVRVRRDVRRALLWRAHTYSVAVFLKKTLQALSGKVFVLLMAS
jgi:hypothetical protein